MGKSKQKRIKAKKTSEKKKAQLETIIWQREMIRANEEWNTWKQQEDQEKQEIKHQI